MDPTTNPFAPGAGISPPELAGRDKIITNATAALGRVKAGRHAKSQMLLGLRGVGKTVLLNRIRAIARDQGYLAMAVETPENRSLAETLVPELRRGIYDLSIFLCAIFVPSITGSKGRWIESNHFIYWPHSTSYHVELSQPLEGGRLS